MAELSTIIPWLERQFAAIEVDDSPRAANGLQVEAAGEAALIAAAVDACEATISEAASLGANLMLVHHGLFWTGLQPVTGPAYRKLALLLGRRIALFSMHLPLDAHPQLGNNVLLARAMNLGDGEPWLRLGEGQPVGRLCHCQLGRDDLAARLEAAVGGRIHLCPGGAPQVSRVGIVTGAAGSEIARAAAAGADTLVTGEAPHWAYPLAEELGVNLLLGGHYATETFGVKALAGAAAAHFGIDWRFIDHPTGL